MNMKLRIPLLAALILVILSDATGLPAQLAQASTGAPNSGFACRTGISVPYVKLDTTRYNLSLLGVDSYLDWGYYRDPTVDPRIDLIRILALKGTNYADVLARIPIQVPHERGKVWIVGNEPDAVYADQDILLPEVYGDRYFEVSTLIHRLDPTAKVGFGPIIQPTPIRLKYLDRVWKQITTHTGSDAATAALIDIYTIHNYILNEVPGQWGAAIPLGFAPDDPLAIKITNLNDALSPSIFMAQLVAFRTWMANRNEQNKPLWVTEFGVLFPPNNPYYPASEEATRDFMVATFNGMLNAKDPTLGYPADENRLVQKWYWFSLNADQTYTGGSLYDGLYSVTRTLVGDAFVNFSADDEPAVAPDFFPVSVTAKPKTYSNQNTTVDYSVTVEVGNASMSNRQAAAGVRVSLSTGTVIGEAAVTTARCAGDGVATFDWNNIDPTVCYNFKVETWSAAGSIDVNASNNVNQFSVCPGLPVASKMTYIPIIRK